MPVPMKGRYSTRSPIPCGMPRRSGPLFWHFLPGLLRIQFNPGLLTDPPIGRTPPQRHKPGRTRPTPPCPCLEWRSPVTMRCTWPAPATRDAYASLAGMNSPSMEAGVAGSMQTVVLDRLPRCHATLGHGILAIFSKPSAHAATRASISASVIGVESIAVHVLIMTKPASKR